MSKTKPTGVRFDENLLSELKKDNVAFTPQKALNFYEEFYRNSKIKNITPGQDIKIVNLNKPTQTIKNITEEKPKTINTKDNMPEGLSASQQIEWRINH